MRNYKNCEPHQLLRDLHGLIAKHNRIEALRRIEADARLEELKLEILDVSAFIKAEGGVP